MNRANVQRRGTKRFLKNGKEACKGRHACTRRRENEEKTKHNS